MLLRSPPRRLHLVRPHHLRVLSNSAAALHSFTQTPPPMPNEWTEVPVSSVRCATRCGNFFHISLDLSSHPSLLASHVAAGQHVAFRFPLVNNPIFVAIASPPPASAPAGSLPKSFDFLIRRLDGTPYVDLIRSRGKLVSIGCNALGRGFEVSKIADSHEVLAFAYGTGIAAIRSFIESGFGENENTDVTVFYGARNLDMVAYQERFNDWESRGIKVIPVLADAGMHSEWNGQRGYVHNAYRRTKKVVNPSSTGAILCGRKNMYEDVTKALVADGMSEERILTNDWLPSDCVFRPWTPPWIPPWIRTRWPV